MNSLSITEIDLLQEALDALESKRSTDGFSKGLMGVMLEGLISKERRDDPEFIKEKAEREEKERVDEMESEQKQRILKERVVLIKAKLIQMKDTSVVEELTAPKER